VAENNFAHALTKQGRPDEAIVHFRAASDLEPDDPVSELNLGIYAQEHGDLQQAVARYDLVLQLATDTDLRATAYANLGTVYFALHDFDRAQRHFDAAIQLRRVFPIVLLDMGLIAQNAATKATSGNNDWNRAANYFEQYVSADPTDVGYLLLANALQQSNRGSEAKLAYQQALKLSNDIDQTRQRTAHLAGQSSPPGPDLR
jgi:tetratricopeptide (TPR) repeat protein